MYSNAAFIKLRKSGMWIIFDIKVITQHSTLCYFKFRRHDNNIFELVNMSKDLQETQYTNYFEFHKLIGHMEVKITELIGKNLEDVFTNSENKISENCLVGKA